MKNFIPGFIFSLFLFLLPFVAIGQNVFSEKDFEYNKALLPYDVTYTFPLKDKEFVMLSESKKTLMKLGRYDQYFFEKWEKEIYFNEDESVPQIFVRGDSVIAFSFTILSEKRQSRLTFRYFDLESGAESAATKYVFDMIEKEGYAPKISFNENHTKFVIYNHLVNLNNSEKVEFQIFEIGSETPMNTYQLDPDKLASPRYNAVHLSDDGDLFLVVVSAEDYKTETYYWSSKSKEISLVNSNFFFERPVEFIGEINIVRQGASSYFVSFTALIEDELIGFSVTGVNVVLKTVMFTHIQNFRRDDILSVYENYYVTSPKQKKKKLAIPEILEQFSLVKSIVNTENDILLVFEQLEIPTAFHENSVSENMPWKPKVNEDKFYFGGDLLLYCFTERGEIKWKKAIQKTQYSQANTMGLSFISKMEKDELKLLMYESSKGGNFYLLDIDTKDGSLTKTTNLLPDNKYDFSKKYSCWLSAQAVLIFTIAPTNINKRGLKLVEF